MPRDEPTSDPSKPDGRRPLQGDEAELFAAFNPHLVRIVMRRVTTSPDIVDDACSIAWTTFLRNQPDRKRSWRSWLIVIAEREAWRLNAKELQHRSLESHDEHGRTVELEPADPRDVVGERFALREALGLLARVPERRRRAKELQLMGFTYEEIGERLGISRSRVNHFIDEANEAIRQEYARTAPEHEPRSPRVARLRELEQSPPEWLVKVIGRPPRVPAEKTLDWRRAALAVDDYRRQHGPDLDDGSLGPRPTDGAGARAYDLAARTVARLRLSRRSAKSELEDERGVNHRPSPSLEL